MGLATAPPATAYGNVPLPVSFSASPLAPDDIERLRGHLCSLGISSLSPLRGAYVSRPLLRPVRSRPWGTGGLGHACSLAAAGRGGDRLRPPIDLLGTCHL